MAASKSLGALYGQLGMNTAQWDAGAAKAKRDLGQIQAAGIRASQKISTSFRTMGRSMKRTGRTLNRTLTVPLLAAGGAALKFGSDFEDSLAAAKAQADLTSEEISVIGDTAEDMAIRTGEATADIIEAYKFTLSAGLDLAESQKLVEAATEASAAGFGKQRELVRLATTALQAYGDRLDSSRQFMDLLVGSAQAMELEVRKLGPALQRNVGIAKELGVGMDQLLAGIGSVSEVMGDANRGGRLFQGMLARLLKPTSEGEEAISAVYGSVQNLHEAIREDGLIESMVRLREGFKETNKWGLENVFSSRRLEAALNLTNKAGERAYEILGDMGDTAGSTAEAFDKSATFSRNLSRAWEALKASLRPLGNVLMETLNPALNTITDSLADVADKLNEMTDESRMQLLKFAGLFAVSGPALIAIGGFVSFIGGFVGTMGRLMKTLVTIVSTAMGRIGLAFIAGLAIGQRFFDNMQALAEGRLEDFSLSFSGFADSAVKSIKKVFTPLTNLADDAFGQLADGIKDTVGLQGVMENFWSLFEDGAKSTAEEIKAVKQRISALADEISRTDDIEKIKKLTAQLRKLRAELQKLREEQRSGGGAGSGGGVGGFEVSDAVTVGTDVDMSAPSGIDLGLDRGLKRMEEYMNKLEEIPSHTEAALGDTRNLWEKFSDAFGDVVDGLENKWDSGMAGVQEVAKQAVNQLMNMFGDLAVSLGQMIGRSIAGLEDSFATGFEQIILIVLDFAKSLAQLAGGIGGVLMFIPGMQGVAAGLLAASVALSAIVAGFKGGINKRISNRRKRAQDGGSETSVNDALIQSDGSVIDLHPNDDVLAAQDLSNFIPQSPTDPVPAPSPAAMASGGGGLIEVTGVLEGRGSDLVAVINEAKFKMNK